MNSTDGKEKRAIYDIYLDALNGVDLPIDESRRLNKFYVSNRTITEYVEPEEDKKKSAGRPPRFFSAEGMQQAIDEYFDAHKPKVRTDDKGQPILTAKGFPIIDMNPPTISGLALFLGFANRTSLYEYEKEPEFSDTIKTARTRCEEFVEANGMSGNVPPAMAIFALKNYGWSDKQEQVISSPDGSPLVPQKLVIEIVDPKNDRKDTDSQSVPGITNSGQV